MIAARSMGSAALTWAVACTVGAFDAVPVGAQIVSTPTAGAALVLPYLTTPAGSSDRITLATITNESNDLATLHFIFVGADGSSVDADCPVLGRETTWLAYEAAPGGGAHVSFECSQPGVAVPGGGNTSLGVSRALPSGDGLLFVARECQIGQPACPAGNLPAQRTDPTNALLGNAVAIDFGQGFAVSFEAVSFRGVPGAGFGDRVYRFDGSAGEYEAAPSDVLGSYVAPDASITAEALLFTLDGRTDSGPWRARVNGFAYDDDGNPTSGALEFDVLTLTPLDDATFFGANVTRTFGGHLVGHVDLFPVAAVRTDVHDHVAPLGDGNEVRRPWVLGWLVQTAASGGTFAGGAHGGPLTANAAWARELVRGGTSPLVPFGADVPAFDASVDPCTGAAAAPGCPAVAGPPAVVGTRRTGAALAMPVLTDAPFGGDRVTIATVTNTSSADALTLHAIWISPGGDAVDFDCPVLPLETTYFVFEAQPGSGNSTVTFECSTPGVLFPSPADTNIVATHLLPARDGIFFLAAECQAGFGACPAFGNRTDARNLLMGDVTLVDFGQGYAASAEAFAIRGVPGAGFGDREYVFDGSPGEYEPFASQLVVNQLSPDDSVSADLVLFTLDRRLNSGPGARAGLRGYTYDDDGNPIAGAIAFDGFAVVPLDAPQAFGGNARRDPAGQRTVGSLALLPDVVARSDVHELAPPLGDGSGARRPNVIAYLFQSVAMGGSLAGGDFGAMASAATASGRTLGPAGAPLAPVGGDVPALVAGPVGGGGGAPTPTACNDGADNDGDGATDFPADTGCSGPGDTSELGSGAAEVPAGSGQTIQTSDGRAKLEIEPGDLGVDAAISVMEMDFGSGNVDLVIGGAPGTGVVAAAYDFEPDGLVFDNPVTLTLVADVTALTPMQRATLDIYRLEGMPATFVALGAMCTIVENPPGVFVATCVVEIHGFSVYAILGRNPACSDGIDNDGDMRADGDDPACDGPDDDSEENDGPSCDAAVPSPDKLWSPNHKFARVGVEGVSDPNADEISITITAIHQDEPTLGKGSGKTCPDGRDVGRDRARIRRERSGNGDGRVYTISFEADDGEGGSCTGAVSVCVPHDQETGSCVDQGPIYDSTECP